MTVNLLPFESHQPMAVRFLTQALETHRMVNAYVLRGADLSSAYQVAQTLAQILNCTARPTPSSACGQCQPCRWIGQNAHPDVVTLTNLTYLPEVDKETGLGRTKTGKPQTQMVVEQLDNLLGHLGRHSGGTVRVVIVAGAEVLPKGLAPTREVTTPPRDWACPDDETALALLPLDRKLFGDTLANKFLKTLEEPPPDVVFFLLTDSEEKLLETIVSRCQVVPFMPRLQGAAAGQLPLALEDRVLRWYDAVQAGGDYADLTQALVVLASEEGVALPNLLQGLQAAVYARTVRGELSPGVAQGLKKMLARVDHANRMIAAKVKPEPALEAMVLSLQGMLP